MPKDCTTQGPLPAGFQLGLTSRRMYQEKQWWEEREVVLFLCSKSQAVAVSFHCYNSHWTAILLLSPESLHNFPLVAGPWVPHYAWSVPSTWPTPLSGVLLLEPSVMVCELPTC